MAGIVCTDVSHRFGDRQVLEGLSFSVEPGESFCLLGPNGAGKSTIFNVLATMLSPDAGMATVGGHDVVRDASAARMILGIVFQQSAIDDKLTVYENLDMHAVLHGIARADRIERIADALSWAALEDVASKPAGALSGGMRRRLELARALMHRPRVLLMDEPSAGLDVQSMRDLWQRLEAQRQAGRTLFMTSHSLEEAEACDQVGILDRGTLIACGPPDALKREVIGTAACSLEDVFLTLTGSAPPAERYEIGRPGARMVGS